MYRIDNFFLNPEKIMVTDLTQKGEILSDKNSGRRQDFGMYLGNAATFYNYTFTMHKRASCSAAEWDELFRILTNPVREHTLVMPHDQGETPPFVAYISSAYRPLIGVERSGNTQMNKWGDIAVEFVATEPQWRLYESQPFTR